MNIKKLKLIGLANRKTLAKLIPNAEDRENLGYLLNEEVVKNDLIANLEFIEGKISLEILKHRQAYAMTIAHMAWRLGFDNIGRK